MSVLILNMPDDPKQIPSWIEEQIVGTELQAVVSELSVIHSPQGSAPSLDEVLKESRSSILASGLSRLTMPQIQSLLVHPQLLLELQEEVAISGGDFWCERASRNAKTSEQIERHWAGISTQIAEQESVSSVASSAGLLARRKRASAILAAASILAAACLLLWQTSQPPEPLPGWGWQASGVLTQEADAPQHLRNLASAASEWFNKRPDSAADLAIRIGQFRSGCSLVMLAEHRPLAQKDRRWLVERCRVWAGKLDESRNRLESGVTVDEVQAEVDATLTRLVAALESRAAGIEKTGKAD